MSIFAACSYKGLFPLLSVPCPRGPRLPSVASLGQHFPSAVLASPTLAAVQLWAAPVPCSLPSAAGQPLPPFSNFSCREVARESLIANRLEHHSTIQSTLFQRENPPQIVISVHSLFPSAVVLQNWKASRASWPQLPRCAFPGSQVAWHLVGPLFTVAHVAGQVLSLNPSLV